MGRRREVYARYSPVFWGPARGVTEGHAAFLAEKVSRGGSVGLRTDRGFLIGDLRGAEGLIDDFAVEADDDWAIAGAALLCSAWPALANRGAERLRVVTAAADEPKVAILRASSLEPVEQWWVKPVDPSGPPAASGRVEGSGFSGLLGPAPPVYDPGGPVLLVDRVTDGTGTAAIEEGAAALGAVLAVLSVPVGADREAELREAMFTVASAWYVGQPKVPTALA
jgi:hypothetical protein